jgi:hypothetical protein
MRNITVAVSDDSYRKARIWAARNDTSVSAVVQDFLLNLPALARFAGTVTAGPHSIASADTPTPLPPPRNKKEGSFSACEPSEIN